MCMYISTSAWGFGVARFDNLGNARAFMSWNEQQTGSTFFCILTDSIKNISVWSGAANGLINTSDMRSILMCLVFLCTLSAAAQDVIIKKDGNTIVCRVVELTKTEVIYKRWTELQGSNYVMSLTDVSAIHYKNGEKKTFNNVTTQSSSSNEQFVFNRESQYIDDGALLAMVNKADNKVKANPTYKKIKRLKIAGWSAGGIMLGIGVPLLGAGCSWGPFDDGYGCFISGLVFSASGIVLTTGCVVKAHILKKKYTNRVTSTPVWQNDFQLNNNAKLSTQICTIQDVQQKAPTLGFGLSYQF